MSDKIKTAAELAEERAKAAATATAPEAQPAPETTTLPTTELEGLKAKAKERDQFHDKYLRSLAEFDNYQKRARKEQDRWREESVRDVLRELLLVLDNLDLALGAAEAKAKAAGGDLANLFKGVSVVQSQLLTLLANRGAKEIEVKVGDPFDTLVHEAVTMQEVPGLARDEVGALIRRGFNLGPTQLRPAQVVVRKATAAAAPPSSGDAPVS
jgi:molecular chaperone GrpE